MELIIIKEIPQQVREGFGGFAGLYQTFSQGIFLFQKDLDDAFVLLELFCQLFRFDVKYGGVLCLSSK